MFWGCIAGLRKGPCLIWDKKWGKIDSENYCEHILPLVEQWLGENPEFSFQQDNVSVYISIYTTAWLESYNIQYIWWPARSLDLNLIENVWSWMKDYIYRVIGNYERVAGIRLKEAIQDA